jgi:hypothetical protein
MQARAGEPVAPRLHRIEAVRVAVLDPQYHGVGVRLDRRQARLDALNRLKHQRLRSHSAASLRLEPLCAQALPLCAQALPAWRGARGCALITPPPHSRLCTFFSLICICVYCMYNMYCMYCMYLRSPYAHIHIHTYNTSTYRHMHFGVHICTVCMCAYLYLQYMQYNMTFLIHTHMHWQDH